MAKGFERVQRVGDSLQREIAVMIQREFADDKRIGMHSITEVRVAKDFSQAKIFVTVMEPEKAAETVQVLNDHSPMMRGVLAKKIQLRTMPKLIFVHDDSLDRGNHISKLIDEAMRHERPPEEK